MLTKGTLQERKSSTNDKVMFNINKNLHPVISLSFKAEKVFSLFTENILQACKKIFKFAPTAFNSCIHRNHVWTAYLPAGISIPWLSLAPLIQEAILEKAG